MQPRSEPLLWLQCLALGAIPLELLLIRLVLAGADPGPVPGVERFLIWGVGVLAPAVALWRRPADWGSLLLVRQPLANRNSDQLRISASHSGLSSRVAVVMAAIILLPVLWWLDNSAVLASEFSPVSGQSRLVTLLLVSPLLALIVWQAQQLVQAAAKLLGSAATDGSADPAFRADAVSTQRTSLGLQLLNIPSLDWPETAVEPSRQGTDQSIGVEDTESETDANSDQASAEQDSTENLSATEMSDNEELNDKNAATNLATAEESDDAEETALTSDETLDGASGVSPSPLGTDDSTDNGSEDEELDDESAAINLATSEESDDAEKTALTSDQNVDEASDGASDVSPTPLGTDDSTDNGSEDEELGDESAAINLATSEESDDTEPEAAVEPVDPQAEDANPSAPVDSPPESSVADTAALPVEPEQTGEEEEGTALNPEISQVDSVSGGSAEGHREQAEPSGGKQSEPEQSSETPPGSL